MTNMETREPSPTDGGVATPTPGPASTNATTTTTSNTTTTGKGVASDESQSHVEAGGDDDDAKTEASTDEEEEEPEQEPHRDTTADTSTHNQPPQDETQGGQEQSRTHEESTPQRHESRSILNSSSEDEKDTSDKSKQTTSREHGEDEDAEEEEEEEEEEDDVLPPVHGEKGVEYTVNELFVNPNLRRKSANKVLKKDPFAIPRATDNVTGYRPRFNPLSILEAEEKLLPRDFKFDFSDGFHGKPQSGSSSTSAKDLSSRESAPKDTVEGSSYFVRKVPPVRNPQTFGDKLATMGLLMGSMPRQAQASPLINTPTVHNPFGEPLLELVATSEPPSSEPITLQPLRGMGPPTPLPIVPEALVPELGLDVDMNGISGLSKLSLVANAAADASLYPAYAAAFGRVAPTTPTSAYDGLMSYLPGHFAEKRLPPQLAMVSSTAQYDVAAFHAANERSIDGVQDEYMDSIDDAYPTDFAPPPAVSRDHAHMNEYDPESTTSSPTSTQQSLQPVAKKPRSKNVFRPCSAPGCTKGARGKSGLCQKHGGGKRCATPNCPKGAQGSSKYCLFHGGGYRCTVPGCTTGARGTSGLCAKHGGYKRARGETDDGETAVSHGGDGQATKNPRLDYEGRAIADSEG